MTDSAQQFDRQHLWHPYSAIDSPLPCYSVTEANGVMLTLDDGRQLIDGMSSWWSAIHGYGHPQLCEAMHAQVEAFSHVMFGGLTHQPAVDLGQRLLSLTEHDFDAIFYADSGSVAVEVAMKMAVQYHLDADNHKSESHKCDFMTTRSGYHGDTFAAMSVTDPENGMHHLFKHALKTQHFVEQPGLTAEDVEAQSESLRSAFEQYADRLAAFIIEPIVQGAGGMRFYHPSYLKLLRQLCDKHNVLLIFDEIATGFGRTGSLFAYQAADVKPDIITLGKALTGGMMSFAATLTTQHVAKQVSANGLPLMHGPTFMANPLACSVACASIDLLQSEDWLTQVSTIEQSLNAHLSELLELDYVIDLRIKGAIAVCELNQAVNMAVCQQALVDAGVWVRPFGRLLYLMPPFIISDAELAALCAAVVKVVKQPQCLW